MKRITQKVNTQPSHLEYNSSKLMSSSENFRSEISLLWKKEGADKIFRTQADFKTWLNTPNPGLSGAEPVQFIKSDIKKISDLLGRILHGILA